MLKTLTYVIIVGCNVSTGPGGHLAFVEVKLINPPLMSPPPPLSLLPLLSPSSKFETPFALSHGGPHECLVACQVARPVENAFLGGVDCPSIDSRVPHHGRPCANGFTLAFRIQKAPKISFVPGEVPPSYLRDDRVGTTIRRETGFQEIRGRT